MSAYRLLYTREAARRIKKLDRTIKDRIGEALEKLSLQPELGKPLTGWLGGRRSYRVGAWRILYKIRHAELLILILTVGHRREVYRD